MKVFIKINFDGSKSSYQVSSRCVIHNWSFIQVGTFYLGITSILVAEATTMRNGIRAAVQARFTNIYIRGNNKALIQVAQEYIQTSWEIQVLVQDVHSYFQSCNHVIVKHIFRESNRVADWLTKVGLALQSTVWNQISHMDFYFILTENNIEKTIKKRTV